jgi:hypothetical protein
MDFQGADMHGPAGIATVVNQAILAWLFKENE